MNKLEECEMQEIQLMKSSAQNLMKEDFYVEPMKMSKKYFCKSGSYLEEEEI